MVICGALELKRNPPRQHSDPRRAKQAVKIVGYSKESYSGLLGWPWHGCAISSTASSS